MGNAFFDFATLNGYTLVMVVTIGYLFTREPLWLRNKYFTLIALIGWMYPVGKFLQVHMAVPSWIRWYLADVGFISCIAILLVSMGMVKRYGYPPLDLLIGVAYATAVAITFELFQLVAIDSKKQDPTILGASGDWIDLSIFAGMFIVNVTLVLATVRQLRLERHEEKLLKGT